MTDDFPQDLQELVWFAFGDRPVVAGSPSDGTVYTLMVLGEDGELYHWLASLSLDDRWTLSPRALRYS